MSQKDEDDGESIGRASDDQCGGHCQNEKNDMDDISSHEDSLSSTFQNTPQLCCVDEWHRIIFLRGLIPRRKVLDL
jgi:hypothetical protein